MNDSQLKHALRRVPAENGQYKYVPLHELHPGTVITIQTNDPKPPKHEDDILEVNGHSETEVFYPSAGEYTLEIQEWGVIKMINPDGTSLLVKPSYRLLTVTAPFIANFDQNYVTFRLETGAISEIRVGNIVISEENTDEALAVKQNQREKNFNRFDRPNRRFGPRGSYAKGA